MLQQTKPESHRTSLESMTPGGLDQGSQDSSYHFPGSSPLCVQRLVKGVNRKKYSSMYQLRYQVFCHEVQFLDPDQYPSGLETDAFDTVSEHFLASRADRNGDAIAAVRLVRWSERRSFPTAKYYGSLLEQLQRLGFPLASTAEISRLCIAKQYCQRAKNGLPGQDGYQGSGHRRKRYPEVILELFKVMYLASRFDLGITHWIAAFESSLYRLLDRYGVHLEPLSLDEIDYHGKVRIYGASISQILETMKIRRAECYTFFTESLAKP